MSNLSDITAAILAGGLGKRLRSKVFGRPKVLVAVNNQPFLQYLLDQLNSAGFRNVVICAGYLGNQIKEKIGKKYKNLSLMYSQEKSPLGTGGALRLALPLLKSETILVMNGDSFYDVNFNEFLLFHSNKKADASLAVLHGLKTDRFGKVKLGLDDKILGFEEKKKGTGFIAKQEACFINAGIYLLKRSLISKIPEGINTSLEKEIFPKWIDKSFYGHKSKGRFIDIGTPDSYKQAENFFKKRFVLLDRDGTIILDKDHLTEVSEVELIPNAAKAIKKLNNLGLGIIIVTNQSVVGRGNISLKDLELIHKKIFNLLSAKDAIVDAIYFCPHKPEENCSCRKPKLGLIEEALKKHDFASKECFVIGDKALDVEMGQRMGATTFLVRTGYGAEVEKMEKVKPDYIVNDLLEAADIIQTLQSIP